MRTTKPTSKQAPFSLRRPLALTFTLVLLALACSTASASAAASSWWKLSVTTTPTVLTPGSEARLVLQGVNLGDASVAGDKAPIVMGAKLPPWLEPTEIYGAAGPAVEDDYEGLLGEMACRSPSEQPLPEVNCEFAESLPPFGTLEIVVIVKVAADAPPSGAIEEAITGGETAAATRTQTLHTGESTPFGVENYELVPENEGGTVDTQAGSHPFQLTSTIVFNQKVEAGSQPPLLPTGPELLKDVRTRLPAGLVGNANAYPQCTTIKFDANKAGFDECPNDTAIGVAQVTVSEPKILGYVTDPVPIFNLTPARGEPARFGFEVENVNVVLDTSVRTGEDYGVNVSASNITEVADLIRSVLTFWGEPGNPVHDASRGWDCIDNGIYVTHYQLSSAESCTANESSPKPFLTMPTSCPTNPTTGLSEPLQTSVEVDSWSNPGVFTKPFGYTLEDTSGPLAIEGCGRVPFEAVIKASPDIEAASRPSGLSVDVHVPQETTLNPEGISTSDVKDIQVTLPEGMTLNPSGANELEACSEGLVGYEPGASSPPEDLRFSSYLPGSVNALTAGDEEPLEPGKNFCPDASKVAKVKIKTPLLPAGEPLEGSVYLAAQNANPFGSLVAMYLVAEDPVSGVLVKLPGEVSLNQTTGQITATFKNNPQLPFEDAELEFFGGERSPLSTPAYCRDNTPEHPGDYTTTATFTPWSGNKPVTSTSSFDIRTGPNGSPCPGSSLPFSPSLTGGMTNINAGAFSPLTTTIGREDGQQNINQVQLKMPAGLSGILAGVPLCGEQQANEGTCSSASQIGSTIVSVGLGGDPYSVTGGRVYLTGPYQGAPFGLSIVNPAVAGPFNLGNVIVRAKIEVNPTTAALTVTTNSEAEGYAIPHILQGIPLEIKHINVTIERNGFTFNPTNCTPAPITGSVGSFEGASSAVSVPFQVTNCATLKFAPKFAVSTPGHTSKVDGAGLTAKLSYPVAAQGTQADIKAVKVDLPKQLPSRLTTLQKACTAKQFEANPADCPKASKIGYAKVHTPLLPVPLEGPAIFVSHGGEAFPSLTMVLQGYGVTVNLVGTTYISHAGITSTTFKTVPDVPFSTFELTLGQGPYSALAANLPAKDKGNFCGQTLSMPTAFLAQNGLEIHETTKISISDCPKTKKAKKTKRKPKKGKGKKQA
jgi:hypothetical protein